MTNIFVLSGAGISAESGIPTFRDANGLWENHRVEDVADPGGFRKDPELVLRFYNERRQALLNPDVKPNLAHEAFGKLQQYFKGKVTIVTQNIDDLHERGGAVDVTHIHGELLKKRCLDCGEVTECLDDMKLEDYCQSCRWPTPHRPHVVWFTESILEGDKIYNALGELGPEDIFIAIGTSGQVYPASDFLNIATRYGARTICLDTNASCATNFKERLIGPATETAPFLVDQLLYT